MQRTASPATLSALLPAALALPWTARCQPAQEANDEGGVVLMAVAPDAQYEANPFVIPLQEQATDELRGGIVAADLDGDGLLDYLFTCPGSVGAYGHDGEPLWIVQIDIRLTGKSENEGLPGLHAPGGQAADVDGDGQCEVLLLTEDGSLAVLDGSTGEEKMRAQPPVPQGVEKWEFLVVCDLRGQGDRDLILQATPAADAYKMGRFLAAYGVRGTAAEPLWQTDRYLGCAHGPVRVADIDGDGRDEVCGGTLFDHEGTLIDTAAYPEGFRGHFDSVYAYDVRPDVPGLEVVLFEEGSNGVGLLNVGGALWRTDYQAQEPQNAAVGDFDTNRAGLEIWCRSRYDTHQKPWVFDAEGNLIAHWEMDTVAPEGWTEKGVEEISTIDWTGEPKQLAAAKERHTQGDVCVFDPMTGEFLERLEEQASRLYVADVAGDWREELIVVTGNEIHVHHNEAPNPHPERKRLWTDNYYRRAKMNWNYYSP
jgi:hypothetical protein